MQQWKNFENNQYLTKICTKFRGLLFGGHPVFNVECNALVDMTLIRPLNKGQGHSFWYTIDFSYTASYRLSSYCCSSTSRLATIYNVTNRRQTDRRNIVVDPGVDGLKRLRLTPKFDWFDASQFFRRRRRRVRFSTAIATQLIEKNFRGDTVEFPTLWVPR